MSPWPPPDPLSARLDRAALVRPPDVHAWQLPPRDRSWTRWLGLIVPAVVLFVVFAAGIERKPASPYPDSWDPRVAELVEFVERERELRFDHPVEVRFLSTQQFDAELDGFEPSFANDESAAAVYDVLGLADDYDPTAATAEGASRLLGYFDGLGVTVRGDVLTPAVKSVIVHELTHALQAQHFDFTTMDSDTGLAVIEGDAVRIENRWIASLPEDEQLAISEELYGESASEDPPSEAVDGEALPWALGELQSLPYIVGPSFLDVIEASGGTDAVNEAFRSLPTEQELYDPWQYFERTPSAWVPPLELDAPAGTDVVQPPRPLSLFEALVIFDTWLGWQDVRRSLDPWRDGAIVAFRRGGATCVTIVMRMEHRDDTERAIALVARWAFASGSDAKPRVNPDDGLGREVIFTSCDRSGPSIPSMPEMTPSWSIAYENQFVAETEASAPELDRRVTRCAARQLVDNPALTRLFTETQDPERAWEVYSDVADDWIEACQFDRAQQALR